MKFVEEIEEGALVPTWPAIGLVFAALPVVLGFGLLVHRVDPGSTWAISPAAAGAVCVGTVAMLGAILPGPLRALAGVVALVVAVVVLRVAFR